MPRRPQCHTVVKVVSDAEGMKVVQISGAVLALSASVAFAGPREDAAFIWDQLRLADGTIAEFEVMSENTVQGLDQSLSTFGAHILDRGAFKEALIGPIRQATVVSTREVSIQSYLDTLTPEELREIAEFYRSPVGQGVLYPDRRGPLWALKALLVRRYPFQITAEHEVDLMRPVMAHVQNAQSVIQRQFSHANVASLIARRDLVAFHDERLRAEVIRNLRESPPMDVSTGSAPRDPSTATAASAQPASR